MAHKIIFNALAVFGLLNVVGSILYIIWAAI
jgi:hypothetical protein